jgi:ribulose-phosphate 3-epimerase
MKDIKLAASILAGDLANLSKSVKEASDAGVDLIHIDIVDGHFAPNITFGAGTVAAIRSSTSLQLDTHLMISHPENYVLDFIKAGSDILTIHAETCNKESAKRMMEVIKKEKKKMGLALKPGSTQPEWSMQLLNGLYLVNVMTVDPGFSGQSMDTKVLSKLTRLSESLSTTNPTLELEVDGGVSSENAKTLVDAGATILVAGAAVYRRGKVREAVRMLRENMTFNGL